MRNDAFLQTYSLVLPTPSSFRLDEPFGRAKENRHGRVFSLLLIKPIRVPDVSIAHPKIRICHEILL